MLCYEFSAALFPLYTISSVPPTKEQEVCLVPEFSPAGESIREQWCTKPHGTNSESNKIAEN